MSWESFLYKKQHQDYDYVKGVLFKTYELMLCLRQAIRTGLFSRLPRERFFFFFLLCCYLGSVSGSLGKTQLKHYSTSTSSNALVLLSGNRGNTFKPRILRSKHLPRAS